MHLSAQAVPDATLYRVFLRDGSALVSYGEFARVADRVVLSLVIGGTAASPSLQLLSIPSDSVDWEKTDAYAESARATRYGATRGPDDYAMLNSAVSRALSDISVTVDPARKLAMATEARQNVTRWVADHYGYRAADVARLAGLFDDVIAETHAAGGGRDYSLSLVANMAAPPAVPMMPEPTLQESVEQALRAAAIVPDAAERTSLLRSIERVLMDAGVAAWQVPLRVRVAKALAAEERTDRDYAVLTKRSLHLGDRYARSADVTGVENTIGTLLREDDRLGRLRPHEMASVLAMMDGKLDAARRLRLARDNASAHADDLRRYRSALEAPLAMIQESRSALDEIRRLAGPTPVRLSRLEARMAATRTAIRLMTPPVEAKAAQGELENAVQLAVRAVDTRRRAIASADMQIAWDASSAAAGALMLFDRASEDLQLLLKIPR